MKLLVAFLLVLCARAQGRIVTKCELRNELVKVVGQNPNGLNVVNLVARREYLFLTFTLEIHFIYQYWNPSLSLNEIHIR